MEIYLPMHFFFLLEAKTAIYSDSTAALSSLENNFNYHPLVLEIYTWVLLCHTRGHQTLPCWLPTHVFIDGNETAYEMAKAEAFCPA